MKKIFFMFMFVSFLSLNTVLAEDGYYADTFRPTGGHKVRTNPIGQWFDDQMNKSYVQKKNQPAKTDIQQNTNNGFGGYNNSYNNQPKKPATKSNGGWSS